MTDEASRALHFTFREWSHLRMPMVVWLAVSALATVAGAFGTHDAMSALGRALYWSGTVGLGIVMSIGAGRLARGGGLKRALGVWAAFVLALSGVGHLANSVIFPNWGGWQDWIYLTAVVGITAAAVHLLIRVLRPSVQQEPLPPKVEVDIFQRRLPLEIRGALVRIEAQDHYLNVVTQKGSALILMRMGDAMADLEGGGLQVHRSHWVSETHVAAHRRDKGRDVLVMTDDAEVPVSRSFRAKARERALF